MRAGPALLLLGVLAFAEGDTSNDFSGGEGQTPFVFRRREEAAEPELKDGRLQLLFGRAEQKCSAAFERTFEGEPRRVDTSFRVTLTGQHEGFCFALLHTGRFDVKGALWDPQPTRRTSPDELRTPDWAEPNLRDSLAVGFDVKNPKDEDWFNANGNFYGRPEREVSLHFDGREVANAPCEAEVATGEPVAVRVLVQFVTGGAEVTVEVDGRAVYDRRFVPHVLPYECRAAFGAHGTGEAFLDDVDVRFTGPAAPSPAPVHVEAIRKAWVFPGRGQVEREVELLPADFPAERILLTVTYDGPMHRDYWDRSAAVYAFADDGARFELARLITPFMLWDRSYRYDADVTAFAPLLHGKRRLAVMVSTAVARGFLVDATLTYYRRPEDVPPGPVTVGLGNLWSGNAHFNRKGHAEEFFAARELPVPEGATHALVRLVVTGHGVMEFTRTGRTLVVDGKEHANVLWKTDCYLNPHRPQFGTWKFDRAGWAPGSVVEPWTVEVPELGETLKVAYRPDPFETSEWADHWVEAQVIFRR